MSELAVRASAGMEMAVFAKHDPGLMPRLLDAALPCVRRDQTDAHGIKSLFRAHPQAFAQTLLKKPGTQAETIEKVRAVLRQLPSRTDADALMARLTGEIERITAHWKKIAETRPLTLMPHASCASNPRITLRARDWSAIRWRA
jgi:hypothetical protein